MMVIINLHFTYLNSFHFFPYTVKIAVESIKIPQLIPGGFRQSVQVLVTRVTFLEDKKSWSPFFVLKLAASTYQWKPVKIYELEFKMEK